MSRAQAILESDVIADMMQQMDDFAASKGGYFNGTGGRLDRSNDDTNEKFYFDRTKFTSRKGGKIKPRHEAGMKARAMVAKMTKKDAEDPKKDEVY